MPSPPGTDLALAVAAVRRGGVIACPTEAVWGLSCDPLDQAAVSRLLVIKHRDVAKGLILVASDAGQLEGLIDWGALPAANRAAVLASWPGPNTWVLPALPAVPRWITGDHDSVAVRVSAHPLLVALCRGVGRPLVSTSANAAGEPPARTLAELAPALLEAVDAVLAGDTGGLERPTTIRDARSGAALRD